MCIVQWIHFCISPTDDNDMLSEEIDNRMQGLDSFESMLSSLGLTNKLPVPDPVTFSEGDPLGAKIINISHNSQDIVASISK